MPDRAVNAATSKAYSVHWPRQRWRHAAGLRQRLPWCPAPRTTPSPASGGQPCSPAACSTRTGIDVEPTDARIYVAGLEKSWEYGGWPKVIMALDQEQLESTYREIPADTARRARSTGCSRCHTGNGSGSWPGAA
jgi:hypothetical protein